MIADVIIMRPVNFSPAEERIASLSDWAGTSGRPISLPPRITALGHNVDGARLARMTHNADEDMTLTWGQANILKAVVSKEEDAF